MRCSYFLMLLNLGRGSLSGGETKKVKLLEGQALKEASILLEGQTVNKKDLYPVFPDAPESWKRELVRSKCLEKKPKKWILVRSFSSRRPKPTSITRIHKNEVFMEVCNCAMYNVQCTECMPQYLYVWIWKPCYLSILM